MYLEKYLVIFISFIFFQPIEAQDLEVYFENNSEILTEDQFEILETFIETNQCDTLHLKLSGFTNSVGSETNNLKLASKRLKSVAEFLLYYDFIVIDDSVNFGESQLIYSESESEEIKLSRRVKIHINQKITNKTEEIEFSEMSLKAYLTNDCNVCQLISLDLDQKTKIVGNYGTYITIYPGALSRKNGFPYKGEAKMKLCEYFNYASILSAGLNTQTKSGLLETGGMVFLEIYDDEGEKLKVTRGRTIHVALPTDTLKDEMAVYLLDENSSSKTWQRKHNDGPEISNNSIKKKVSGKSGKVYFTASPTLYTPNNIRVFQQYQMDLKEFGYINCDREIQFDSVQTIEVKIKGSIQGKVTAYLVFQSFKAVIQGAQDGNKIVFENIPKAESAEVIIIEENEEGKIRSSQFSLNSNSEYHTELIAPSKPLSWSMTMGI